LLFLFRFAWTR